MRLNGLARALVWASLSVVPWLPPAAAGHTWQLSFSEEFETAGYDATKLTPCFDWNYGGCTGSFNQGREYYAASQIRVSGGAAHLDAGSPAAARSAWREALTLLEPGTPEAERVAGDLEPLLKGLPTPERPSGDRA